MSKTMKMACIRDIFRKVETKSVVASVLGAVIDNIGCGEC
jgi:hypothetical protein